MGRTERRGVWEKRSNQCSSSGVIVYISDYKALHAHEIHPWHNTKSIIKTGKIEVSHTQRKT